jgi:hypothetical protein
MAELGSARLASKCQQHFDPVEREAGMPSWRRHHGWFSDGFSRHGEMAELVEGAPLLRAYTRKTRIEGSNPSLSAILSARRIWGNDRLSIRISATTYHEIYWHKTKRRAKTRRFLSQ